jgi:hypothetical protein
VTEEPVALVARPVQALAFIAAGGVTIRIARRA